MAEPLETVRDEGGGCRVQAIIGRGSNPGGGCIWVGGLWLDEDWVLVPGRPGGRRASHAGRLRGWCWARLAGPWRQSGHRWAAGWMLEERLG